jgi:hypothetical protein
LLNSTLPRIPEFTGDFSAQYSHATAIPDWSSFVRGECSYHGRSATDFHPTSLATCRIQHSYDITNFRVGASNDRTGLNMALYEDNVFDVQGDVYIAAAAATPTAKYTNQPRTIGIEVTKKF